MVNGHHLPLYIREVETPDFPPWGTLPLDVYLLSEWETPHQTPESPSERHARLIRQFLQLGIKGREVYTH